MANVIILIGVCIGTLVYFFGFLRPLMKRSAARGRPWRMYPVCCLADYFEQKLAAQRAEKDRLLGLVRQRQAPAPVAPAVRVPVRAAVNNPPPPVGKPTLMKTYRGKASISLIGPAGELFLFLDQEMTDATGRSHTEVATTVLVPPQARPFLEECIDDQRPLLVSCVPANEFEARLRVTVEEADGRLVPLREWILEQALHHEPVLAGPVVPVAAAPRTIQVPFARRGFSQN